MSSSLSPELLYVISDYLPALERMSSNNRDSLFSGLKQMKQFGVDSFAIRVIDRKGYSAMFCTNTLWPSLIKDEQTYSDFKNHISSELVFLYKKNCHLTSRSGDKIYSPFLKRLEDARQNNSIIISDFYKKEIVIIYFMPQPQYPQDRDLILNNLRQLIFIKDSFNSALKELIASKEFQANKRLLLNKSAIDVIWAKDLNAQKTVNLFLSNNKTTLTIRELESLYLLKFGASNKFIGDTLGISSETVKHHLLNLKNKLDVPSRKKLIEISHSESFINIFKIIGEQCKIKT